MKFSAILCMLTEVTLCLALSLKSVGLTSNAFNVYTLVNSEECFFGKTKLAFSINLFRSLPVTSLRSMSTYCRESTMSIVDNLLTTNSVMKFVMRRVLTLIQRFCWERPELSWCAIPELTLAGKFQRYARVEKDNPLVAVPLALGYTFEPSQRKSENPPNLEPRLLEWCCPYRKEFFYRGTRDNISPISNT